MSKDKIIKELTTILSASIRHKIGSIVNNNEIYAQRYAKDSESLLNSARKSSKKSNWNNLDKEKIKSLTKEKLIKELEEKTFLDQKKFDYVDKELEEALKDIGL